MNKIFKSVALSLVITSNLININTVQAKQSTNANPWGYTGLINMPTADVIPFGEFYITGNYLFKNPGFIANAHIGIFDRLELGLVGGIPSAGFSGLAGNIKYQLIKPTANSPTALSLGLNMIGLAKDTNLITGNYLYMVLSHDFNWKMPNNSIYNLFSGHVGFGGNIEASRIMAGIDIPVTDYINLEAEYMGKISGFDDMINFGVKVRPLSFLTVSFLTIGTSTSRGFTNTEYLANLSFNAKIPNLQIAKNEDPIPTPTKIAIIPTPEPSIAPTIKPTPEPIIMPTIAPTPVPVILSTPKPTVIPVPEITTEPSIAPTIKPTPKPIIMPTIAPTPLTTIDNDFGTLKGHVKTTVDKDSNVEKTNVTIRGLKGTINKKTKLDNEGSYAFDKIPKGEYILIYEREGFQEERRQLFINSGEVTESNIEMISLNGSISGRIIDLRGNPVNSLVLVMDKGKRTTTNKEGKYTFGNLKVGYHSLSIYKKKKEIKSVDLDIIAGTELTKEIVLDSEIKKDNTTSISNTKIGTLSYSNIIGKITDKNGALKSARIMMEGEKLTVMTISGQDGTYTIKNLFLGTYKMTVSKSGYAARIFSVKVKENKQAKHDVQLNLE